MTRPAPENERFLSRWSRLKRAQVADAEGPAAEKPDAAPPAVQSPAASPVVSTSASSASFSTTATIAPVTPVTAVPPALPAIHTLTMDSDYGQFFQPKVPEALKRAAVKKLFTDPHFNIMDGLDTYIDDYSKADPIPPEMLARLVQARDIIDHPSDRKPEVVEEAQVAAIAEGTEGQVVAEETEVSASAVVDVEAAPEVVEPASKPVGRVERSDTHLPIPEESVGTKLDNREVPSS